MDTRLADVITPIRDVAVGELLDRMGRALDAGAKVAPEPTLRDGTGRILRDGTLHLPRRGDLAVTRNGHTRIERVEGPRPLAFEPLSLLAEGGFTTIVAPFAWDRARIKVEAMQAKPNWTPLRHWYLEWFQTRFSDDAPDLEGALHGLGGPTDIPGGWVLELDLGSAPIGCFEDLIGAFARSGAARITVGELA